ncbi:MAG: serine hydrolase [Gemmatimonadota bacterium]|nr:MAG: serine hydrolase [Gemmatimonadota bacterium]
MALAQAVARLGAIPGMRSFLVSEGGELLEERYFNGVSATDPHNVRSVTKSVTSALVGIALDRGFLTDLDVTVGEHLPADLLDGLDPVKAGITVRDLLRMAHGFTWNQLRGGADFDEWATADDQLEFILARPLESLPGSSFEYSDGAVHMLSVILTGVTGMSTLDFAEEFLFEPMGFTNPDRIWSEDNRGFNAGGVGLRLTPPEMLAFGEMFLNGGVHKGTRVLSSAWVEQATGDRIDSLDIPFSQRYGYLWWVGSGGPFPFYLANGFGGQFIVVTPSRGLVVVTTVDLAGPHGSSTDNWLEAITTIVEDLLPAFR